MPGLHAADESHRECSALAGQRRLHAGTKAVRIHAIRADADLAPSSFKALQIGADFVRDRQEGGGIAEGLFGDALSAGTIYKAAVLSLFFDQGCVDL